MRVIEPPTVATYLRQLGQACIEAANDPRVRPLLFRVLLIAAQTIAQLARERKRVAAQL